MAKPILRVVERVNPEVRTELPPLDPNDPDERLYMNFLEQPAQATFEQIQKIEDYMETRSQASIWRRLALGSLTRSGAQLVESVQNDDTVAPLMADLAAAATEYADRLKTLAEMIEAASMRIELALCSRPDLKELITQAEKRGKRIELKVVEAVAHG